MRVTLSPVPTVPSVKGFDEDSVASLPAAHDELQDSHPAENGVSHSSQPFQGGYMLAASYWPKVNQRLCFHHHRNPLMESTWLGSGHT